MAIFSDVLAQDDVDADSKDNGGRTPLSLAARRGHEVVVELLMERDDVDTASKDNRGRTPLSQAVQYGHKAVAELLRSGMTPSLHRPKRPLSRTL